MEKKSREQSVWKKCQKKNWSPKLKKQARCTLCSGLLWLISIISRPSNPTRCSIRRISAGSPSWSSVLQSLIVPKVFSAMTKLISQLSIKMPMLISKRMGLYPRKKARTSLYEVSHLKSTLKERSIQESKQLSNKILVCYPNAKGNVLSGLRESNTHLSLKLWCPKNHNLAQK